jgi:hypothetical protein
MRDPTPPAPGRTADVYRRLLDEAIATMTRAAHLAWTNPGSVRRCVAERCDWAEFVTPAVAGAAANIGSTDEALAARSGSWEAACVRDMLSATVGPDDHGLHRHRTEPVVVDVNVDAILDEQGGFLPCLATKDELSRREVEARAAIEGRHSPDDLAMDDELDRLADDFDELGDLLDELRQEDWAAYGHALDASIRAATADLPGLAVPVLVTVHLNEARPAARHTEDRPWTLADELLTHAIAATPLPTDGQPPLMDRLDALGGPLPWHAAEPQHAAEPRREAASPRAPLPTVRSDGPSTLGLAR